MATSRTSRRVPSKRTGRASSSKPARRRQAPEFVIVTGLSGAGKSHAIKALEDQGYYCVDNLPIALLPTFADLTLNAPDHRRRAAVVIDIREGEDLAHFPAVYRRLQKAGTGVVRLVFLEAADQMLLRRFSETRRPHPLAGDKPLAEGLKEERRRLQPIRRLADLVLDTSNLTVHELRRRIRETIGASQAPAPLAVTFMSFGFRRGVPEDADLVFDVRFLPNPHFVPTLRPWTGRHPRVSRYVLRTPEAKKFVALTFRLLEFLIPQYIAEGKAYLTVAIGCTGGKHRSVALAEAFAKRASRMKGIEARVRHRDEQAN